jgi:PAS domain S-box-containing protein
MSPEHSTTVGKGKSTRDALQAELEAIYNSASVGLCVFDTELRYLRINERLAEINGLPASEHIGRTFREIVPELAEQAEAIANRILETGLPVMNIELTGTSPARPDIQRTLVTTWVPLKDTFGKTIGINVTAEDITERKRAEQTLRETEEKYRELIRFAPTAIYEIDFRKQRFTSVNEAMCAMTGYSREELLAMNPFDITDDEGRAVFRSRMGKWLKGERPDRNVEFRIRANDGHVFYVVLDVTFTRGEDGKPFGAMVIVHDITERKQAEEALRESEVKYRDLFENMTEEVHFWKLVYDESGQIKTWRLVDVNPPTLKTWGRASVDEIRGKTTDEIFGPGATEHYMPVVRKIMTEGVPHSFEDYFPNIDKHFRFTSVPLGDHFITTGADITSIKKAEERERGENRETAFANRVLRAFVEFEGDALFHQALTVVQEEMASRHGVFGYIPQPGHLLCPSLSRMLDACEIEGKCIHYPPEKWKGLWAKALREKRSLYTNEAPPVPPGHPIIHNNLAAPIVFHGEVIGLLNIANKNGGYTEADRDTLDRIAARIAPVLYAWIQRKLREDERKAAEEGVAAAQRQIQSIIDNTTSIVYAFDLKERFLLANTAVGELLNSTPDQMIGKKRHEFMPKDDADWHEANDAKVIEMGRALEFEEHSQLKGRSITWLTTKFPLRDVQGRIYAIGGISADVSERKRMEDELRKSRDELNLRVKERTAQLERANANLKKANRRLNELNKELHDFAFVASHDLQEPLRKVRSFGDMLAARPAISLDNASIDYVDRMQSAAARMQTLLNSLLSYSRVTTQAEPKTHTDLKNPIESALSNLEIMIREKNARVEIGDLPTVSADQVQMIQLFQNLIGNALKYHRAGEAPHVKVYTRVKNQNTIEICVEDNGIGFDEQYLDRIFLPFQRLHGRSSSFDGVGMGLAICKKIVERHGGEITARSELGNGSTFIVTLPAERKGNHGG